MWSGSRKEVFPVLAGAVGIGVVGHIENAVTFSPQQLVIDNEVFKYMHHALRPIEINNETLALDVVRKVGIGGNFIAEMHTAEHFRDELFLSNLFETTQWSNAHNQDVKGMENKAYELARKIWEEKPEPILDDEKIKAIDDLIARAEKEFIS